MSSSWVPIPNIVAFPPTETYYYYRLSFLEIQESTVPLDAQAMNPIFARISVLILCIPCTFFLAVTSSQAVYAVNYGEGTYSGGNYNEGEATPTPAAGATTSTTNTSSSPSTPSCPDQKPGAKVPWLYSAFAQNSGAILLFFTEASDPVDHYVLEYGTKAGEYPYGSSNIGGKGSRTFLVQSLSPQTAYFFRVRGGNGCAVGEWSNEISATTKGLVAYNQLEFTESSLEPIPTTERSPEGNQEPCRPYTVKSGDTLWSIAKTLLGSGSKYKDLIEQNKETYPSLETSNALTTGWELQIPCPSSTTATSNTAEQLQSPGGYDVKVKVFDTEKKPVQGAKVTLHSTVQEAVTNNEGIAAFTNVEQGEHRVIIAYNGFNGEQTVNLTGDVREFDLNVTVKPSALTLSPLAIVLIIVLGSAVLVLVSLLIRARRRYTNS